MRSILQWWQARSQTQQTQVVLAIILVLSVLLRLPLLTGSFWLDEAAQALESARPLNQQLDLRPDFQPPLLHLITHAAIQFSQQEWWLRAVGAVFPAILTIWLTFKLGLLLPQLLTKSTQRFTPDVPSWAVSAIAAGLLATSSLHIFYSQELRPYSLAVLWAVVSWYACVQLVTQLPPEKSATKKATIILAIATAAGLYSMYLYPFVILSQLGVSWLYFRGRFKQLLLGVSGGVVAFLPWLPSFFGQLAEGQSVRAQLPGWEEVVGVPQFKALPLVLGKFIFGVIDISFSAPFITTTVILIVAVVFAAMRGTITRKSIGVAFKHPVLGTLLLSVVIPVTVSWLVSFAIPVLQPKRLLMVLPLLYLCIAWIVTQLPKHYFRLGAVIVMALLALNIFGTFQYVTQAELQRENWRDLHFELTTKYSRNSIAVFAFDAPFAPWVWYDDGSYPTVATGSLVGKTAGDVAVTLAPAFEYQFVLVFDYLRDITDPDRLIETTLEDWGYQEVALTQRPQIGFVRIYARPTAVLSYNNDLSRH